MEQIEELRLPPNPAKDKDKRFESYALQYCDKSWELDALEPQYIVKLIQDNILLERDDVKWQELLDEQEVEREQISKVIDKWDELF